MKTPTPIQKAPQYGRPVPTKFSRLEQNALAYLAEMTELSQSELIRRAVYVLLREIKRNGWEH